MRGKNGDFNSIQRYLKLWDFISCLSTRKVDRKSVNINMGMKRLLTVPLKYNLKLFEIILSNLALKYRHKDDHLNKNNNNSKNNNNNDDTRIKEEILKVIDWLFKQLTNNNQETFRMEWTILNTIGQFSCKFNPEDNIEDDDSNSVELCLVNLDMVNRILEYLISNNIKCVFPPTGFHIDYFDIYIKFVGSTCGLTEESLDIFMVEIKDWVVDENNKYYHCYGKFLIKCLINIDKLIFNGFEIEYNGSNESTYSSIRRRIETYDDNVNKHTNFRRDNYTHLQSIIWQNVSQISHKNITQLIGESRNKFYPESMN